MNCFLFLLICLSGNYVGLGGRTCVHLIVLYPLCDIYSMCASVAMITYVVVFCYLASLAVTRASVVSSGVQFFTFMVVTHASEVTRVFASW